MNLILLLLAHSYLFQHHRFYTKLRILAIELIVWKLMNGMIEFMLVATTMKLLSLAISEETERLEKAIDS